ncbi:MAG: LytR C-terminal domain-containing protein [Actinomycetota bacterium]|nr:LytR C-terminal domain-containing protein [Actinomycetota bacterium]
MTIAAFVSNTEDKIIKIFAYFLFLIVVLVALYGAIFFLNPPEWYSFPFSSQRAYAAEKPEFMLFGNYVPLETGKYKVAFTLKVDNNKLDEPVATIDIVVNEARDQLACVTLVGTNFTSPNVYQDFDLIFDSSGEKDFEFRVQHYENCNLWVDKVTLARLGRDGEWKFFEKIEAESPNIFHNIGESVSDQDASGGKVWKASKRLTEAEILHPVLEIGVPKLKISEISKSLLGGFLIALLLVVLVCTFAYQIVVKIKRWELPKRERWKSLVPRISWKSPIPKISRKSKLVIILLSLIVFSAIFGSLSISGFVLRIEYLILLHLFLSLIWGMDSRISIGVALSFLMCCPFLLIFKCEQLAERIAIYAFYFLVVGVVLQLIEHMREKIPEEERLLAEEESVEISLPQMGLEEAPGVAVVEKAQVGYLSPRYSKTRMARRRERQRHRRRRLLALGLVSFVLAGMLLLAPGLSLLRRPYKEIASKPDTGTKTTQPEVVEIPKSELETTAPAIDKSKVTIQVLNGNGIKGEARRISTMLEEGGFNVQIPKDANRDDYPETIIHYKPGGENFANLVVQEIKDIYPASLREDLSSDSAADILVILGRDGIE